MSSVRAWTARHVTALSVLAVVLTVATALYAVASLAGVTSRQNRTDDALAQSRAAERVAATARNALASDVDDLRAQVIRCKDKPADTPGCQTPVAPAPEVTVRQLAGVPGATGATGVPGPAGVSVTPAMVASAVGRYCAFGSCSRPPAASQVSAAVIAFCAESSCIGRTGAVGKDGTNGTQGDTGLTGPSGDTGERGAAGTPGLTGAPGAAGQDATPISPQMVAAAVTDYCSTRTNCQGLTGDTGPTGADSTVPGPAGAPGAAGASGRGIDSITCDGPAATQFTITYSDGTTDTVTCNPTPHP